MDKDFYTLNRENLMRQISGPIIITAYSAMQRCFDESWKFEQEANFWYLTGIDDPDWKLIIDNGKSTLVRPDTSEIYDIFNEHINSDQACKISGVDDVINQSEYKSWIYNISKTAVNTIIPQTQADFEFVLNPAQSELVKQLKSQFKSVNDIRLVLHKMRAIKQKPEIMMMRRAINLTRSAFDAVKSELQNYTFEYEAQAKFSYEFERAGADHAYDPIVASGVNAVTLHYNSNRSGLSKDQLVLIDVGAKYGGYCADITRTYFYKEITDRQKLVHDAVKAAKDQIIKLIKPGVPVRQYLEKSDEIMRQALKSLNLYNSENDFRRYYPHAISHGLGIETHDPLGAPSIFKSGMVLTVEPGIYIAEENIGVRLEDDILVNDSGSENLSGQLSDEA